jgi:hypothetical protein
MSHCAVVPLYTLFMDIAGIRPLTPGFRRCSIRPQPADLEEIALTAWTAGGPLRFSCKGKPGSRELIITMPAHCEGELVLSSKEKVELRTTGTADRWENVGYILPAGSQTRLQLQHT